jgi:hypothetical protein
MRTIRLGSRGNDVRLWKTFLIGLDPYSDLIADDIFDQKTLEETKHFQKQVGLHGKDVDGIVGPRTYGHAMILGFDPVNDDDGSEAGPNWPPLPVEGPLSLQKRLAVFGTFAFRSAPIKNNPEAIVITDGWDKKNIVTTKIPQLKKLSWSENVSCHRLIAEQLRSLFDEWDRIGLMSNVLTYGGLWVPRYIRGSRTTLSNHSWGTAFDINVQWNMLGSRPALKGEKGSVRELVQTANKYGFYWGGHFKTRPDGMHFEAYRVL